MTKTQQNFLYDVWHSEKERMYAADICDPLVQQEIQNISDIEGMQQDDDDYNGDMFGVEDDCHEFSNVDFDGNELTSSSAGDTCPADMKESDNEAIFLASIKDAYRSIQNTTESVFNFVGSSLSSVSSPGNDKNGLLHLTHSNK